jgi:glycosyltransferase involved in cell wall biosynthesis
MKYQLMEQFHLDEGKISVIPFGINDTVPETTLSKRQARGKLGLANTDKVILFFGNIAPYKGLEYLLMAMPILKGTFKQVKLIIAGRIKNCHSYWRQIQSIKIKRNLEDSIIERTEFIPDEEVEIYYKAADVLILPYRYIFQSGVLFLSYNFGLPVIATDVGSLREDIMDGETGFLCQPENPTDLAEKIILFFNSSLYENIENNRNDIMSFAKKKYSWDIVGNITVPVYEKLSK